MDVSPLLILEGEVLGGPVLLMDLRTSDVIKSSGAWDLGSALQDRVWFLS